MSAAAPGALSLDRGPASAVSRSPRRSSTALMVKLSGSSAPAMFPVAPSIACGSGTSRNSSSKDQRVICQRAVSDGRVDSRQTARTATDGAPSALWPGLGCTKRLAQGHPQATLAEIGTGRRNPLFARSLRRTRAPHHR